MYWCTCGYSCRGLVVNEKRTAVEIQTVFFLSVWLKNQIVIVKICLRKFWIFMGSLRALPLKIPRGVLPLDPTTFEKVDKTFNCHRYRAILLFKEYTSQSDKKYY